MGRPIKKRNFGSLNYSENGTLGAVGGEEVGSVAVLTSGTYYASTATITFRAPDITGGTTATGTLTVKTGGITGVTITNSGTGYLSTSSLFTISATTGSAATFNASLTTFVPNDIALTAWVNVSGAAARTGGDIIKQEGSHSYYVQTSDGKGRCKLVATTLTAGTMSIIATDYNGNTYWVTKLTDRKASITRKTQNGSNAWVYGVLDSVTGTYIDTARWSLGAAIGTDKTSATARVTIANN